MNENKNRTMTLIIFIAGILIYPLGLWTWFIPNNELHAMGLDMLTYGILTHLIAIAFLVLAIVFIRKNKRKVLFWIGFGLNVVYLSIPAFLFVFILVAVFLGASV